DCTPPSPPPPLLEHHMTRPRPPEDEGAPRCPRGLQGRSARGSPGAAAGSPGGVGSSPQPSDTSSEPSLMHQHTPGGTGKYFGRSLSWLPTRLEGSTGRQLGRSSCGLVGVQPRECPSRKFPKRT
ncbi:hypothetical protein IscW_ISCW008452, partial [Ixodes scapularis]